MGYGMIENIGNLLVDLLCRELVPDVVLHDNCIGLCSPDNHGDLNLGIYLYDISENEDIRAAGMVNAGVDKQTYPPIDLSLYYMITAYSDSDVRFRAPEEHKILGKVIQVLRDNNILSPTMLGSGVTMPAQVQLQRLDQFEKIRMWNFPNEPYKLSLFYKVQPVEISSEKTRKITRVKDASFLIPEDGQTRKRDAFHASLVVLIIDDFTGEPVPADQVTVSIPGHYSPLVKSDGYHVFVNLNETQVELICKSKIFEWYTEQVELTERDENEVLMIRLVPCKGYPVPPNTTCVTGQTQPGRKLMFWKSFGEAYRLSDNYTSSLQEEDPLLAIYNPDHKELEGKTYFIYDREKKEKEFFKIVGKKGRYYRIDRILRENYKKIGTSVIPVYEIHADETGDFFLLMQGDQYGETELVCRLEGKEEKHFLLIPGRVNTITL